MYNTYNYVNCFDQIKAPEDTMDRVYKRLGKPRKRNASRIGLLVAILVPLFAISAVATGISSMNMRKKAADEVLSQEVGYWDEESNTTIYKDKELNADYVLEFNIDGECHEVYFAPGWLPLDDIAGYSGTETGYNYMVWGPNGVGGEIAYGIWIYNGDKLAEKKFVFFDDDSEQTEIVDKGEWLEWKRIDVVELDINRTDGLGKSMEDRQCNFILLFSEEYNYLLVIGGEESIGSNFEVLEKIAENLKINVTDNLVYPNNETSAEHIQLGWG